jgi:hypothetical protein
MISDTKHAVFFASSGVRTQSIVSVVVVVVSYVLELGDDI